MIPQTSDVVVENGDMLPDDLQRALTILSIKEECFTSQELLKAFKEKYQMKMAATCFNLKRWIARLALGPKPTEPENDPSVRPADGLQAPSSCL